MTTPELDAIRTTTLDTLRHVLGSTRHVALVDFPNYANAGDSLILLGELAYLDEIDVKVDYLVDRSRYNAEHLRALVPEGPILLQGGGNFGDRWELFQLFRERVISDFPDREIIQLPQGIEFSAGPRLERAQKVFAGHPRLTLLIRDTAGVEKAKALFPTAHVAFCPDMAFGVGPLKPLGDPTVDIVILQREDSESVGDHFHAPHNRSSETVDWGLTGLDRGLEKLLRVPGLVIKRLPRLAVVLHPALKASFVALARLRVRGAVKILSRGRSTVTDRLHATVFSALMGHSVIALPNANGKVKAICDEYLGTLPGVRFISDASEAVQLAASDPS